jgi:MYXO-CTERM domain-containing protein
MAMGVMPDAGVADAGGTAMPDGGMTAMPDAGAAPDAGAGAAGAPEKPPTKGGGKKGIVGGKLGGGGCNCRAADGQSDAGMLAIALAALWLRRRRASL